MFEANASADETIDTDGALTMQETHERNQDGRTWMEGAARVFDME